MGEFDRHGKCPICHKEFLGDHCPHGLDQVESHLGDKRLEGRIRTICREEIVKWVFTEPVSFRKLCEELGWPPPPDSLEEELLDES